MKVFIATECAINDDLGSVRDIEKKTKKQARSKAKRTRKEQDYFNPDPAVENRLMGLTDKIRTGSSMKGES